MRPVCHVAHRPRGLAQPAFREIRDVMTVLVDHPRLTTPETRCSRQVQLWCAWSGVPFLALFFLGWVALAGFVPPPSPSASAAAIRGVFLDHLTAERVGLLLDICAWSLI